MHLVATAGPSGSSVFERAWRLRRRTKKIRGWGPTPVEPGNAGKDPVMWAARPLGAFRHEANGPAPARQLARDRDVGHAALLAGLVQGVTPVDQAPHAGVGVASGRRVDRLTLGQVLRRPRRALVVPGGLDEQPAQVLVSGFGYAAAALRLAAGMLGGHQSHPGREPRRRREPRETVCLAGNRDGRDRVYALQAFERIARGLPPGFLGKRLHLLIERGLARVGLPDAFAIVVEGGHRGGVSQVDPADPRPEIPGPAAPPLPGGVLPVVHESMPEQELRQALFGAHRVVARVGQGSRQIARALALGIGHVHLGDHAQRELHREELRVAPVGLAAPVGGGLVHLGHGADDAVDAHRVQLAAEVEARHARLVDAFGGLGQRRGPGGDLSRLVPEGFPDGLARFRDERAGLHRPGVHVEPYESGSIVHREAPSMNAAWPLAVWTPLLSA